MIMKSGAGACANNTSIISYSDWMAASWDNAFGGKNESQFKKLLQLFCFQRQFKIRGYNNDVFKFLQFCIKSKSKTNQFTTFDFYWYLYIFNTVRCILIIKQMKVFKQSI